MADTGRAMGYVLAIDQPTIFPSADLCAAMQANKDLRPLGARGFGAVVPSCIQGKVMESLEASIRAQG